MITHSIINEKKKVVVNNFPVASVHSLPYHRRTPQYLSMAPTQTEYDEYLKNCPIKAGDYVCLVDARIVDGLWCVHYVAFANALCPPYTLDTWETGSPKVFTMISCGLATPMPWMRKEAASRYRKLTDEEYKTLVEPYLDNIRNRINKYVTIAP